jgi:uncharacterized protein YbjT (DUF2867 family)
MHEVIDEPVAIIGASGNVGYPLLLLVARACTSGELKGKVKVVSRNPDQLKQRLAISGYAPQTNLEFLCGDVTKPESLQMVLNGVNRVFLCLPQILSSSDMVEMTKSFVDVAVRQGVRHVVRVSSYGIDDFLKGTGISQGPLGNAHVAGEEYTINAGSCILMEHIFATQQ